MKVLIVLPTYNESLVIRDNLKKVLDFLDQNRLGFEWKILVADNGSTDSTVKILKETVENDRRVDYFHIPEKGRGRALKKAWSEDGYDVYCYMDADLATDLKYLKEALDLMASGEADIIVGSRTLKESKTERSIRREITSRVFNWLLNTFLHLGLSDAQCGFKFINKKAAKEIIPMVLDNVWFFDTEFLFLAKRANYRIKELPVNWVESRDARRKSTVKVFRTTIDYLKQIWRLRREAHKK